MNRHFAFASAVLLVTVLPSLSRAGQYSLVYSFPGGTGGVRAPTGDLLFDGSVLYGLANGGAVGPAGIVFTIRPDGTDFQVLHSFAGGAGGAGPTSLMLVNSELVGTTQVGGTVGHGTVFSMNTDGTGFQALHSFTGGSGSASPQAPLTLIGSTLYGTTRGIASSGDFGSVFSINLDGSGFQVLHTFNGGSDGALPMAGLTAIGSTLYGTSSFLAGAPNFGTVFSINANGSGFQVLHTFSGGTSDGYNPQAGLILSGSTLYGTTAAGGVMGTGTVFSIHTDGSGFQLLHSFADKPADGALPEADLTLVGSTLYGTTVKGGSTGFGTVFSLNTDGGNFNLLHSFLSTTGDGYQPLAGLTLVGSTLYGTTEFGGASGTDAFSGGTVFTIIVPEPSTWALLAIGAAALLAFRRPRGRG